MSNKSITLAIVNITSWSGIDADAEHLYGHLILCEKQEVNVNTVEDWNVKYLGENIELKRLLDDEDEAIRLDNKYGEHKTYYYYWKDKVPIKEFNDAQSIIDEALKIYRKKNLTCDFISLYNGERYKFIIPPYEQTVVLTHEQIMGEVIK